MCVYVCVCTYVCVCVCVFACAGLCLYVHANMQRRCACLLVCPNPDSTQNCVTKITTTSCLVQFSEKPGDMSREGIYLIEVAKWFGYFNRCRTIEQVDNRTSTRRVFVPTLDGRSRSLHWFVVMADTSQSYYYEGGPRCMLIHYITWHITW